MYKTSGETGAAGTGVAPPRNPDGGATEARAEDTAAGFRAELSEHWRRHGKTALDTALSKDPVRYLALAAKFTPGDERCEGSDLVALLAAFDEEP